MFSSALKSFSSNITANYTLAANPSSVAGAWKVFDAKSKKTGKQVSVFVFDRKALESGGGNFEGRSSAATRKKVHDEVVDRLKKEASSLARMRHPNILELAEPVEETRGGGLMFATEPITATLASLLRDQDNEEAGRSRTARYRRNDDGEQKEVELDELEIQKGLLQVAKGLEFLHESAKLVHGNLTPDAIYINQKSDWKISGLAFAGPSDTSDSSTPATAPPIALSELLYFDPRLPKTVQLDINYTSPDFVMDTNISSGADMFSLGLIMIALYNSPHESPLKTNNNLSTYKKLFSSSSTVPSASNNFLTGKSLPRELRNDVLPRLITRRAAQRMSAREFQESSFFDNILVNTIRFLDALPAKTPNEKQQFLRGLPRILDQFPRSVLQKKVLPVLLEETKDKDLLALILADVFKIIQLLPSPQRVITDKVLPRLQELFAKPSKGAPQERDSAKEAGLAVVLEHVSLLAETCTGKQFKDYVLPIVILGMESATHSIVDKALQCLSTMISVLDFSSIKNELFPIVAAVFSKTSSLAIKIRGLEAFVILCGGSNESETIEDSTTTKSAILDKYTVQEKIVPLMKGIKTKEPAVMMASLNVFKQVMKLADVEFLATEVLPIVWAFSLGPLLNMQQFKQYMDLIKGIGSRIEAEQIRKLQALASENTTNGAAGTSNDLMSIPANDSPFSPSAGIGEDDFARLVLGKSTSGGGNTSSQGQGAGPGMNTTVSSPFAAHPGTPKHDFGWNSSQTLQPQSNSRAITPDFTSTISSFPVMSPGSSFGGSSMQSQTQQPLQPNIGMSAGGGAFGANPWGSTPIQPQQPQQQSNYSAWSSPPPAASSTTGWSLPPPPGSGQSNGMGSLNSMGGTGGTGMSTMSNGAWGQTLQPSTPSLQPQWQQQQQQAQQRQAEQQRQAQQQRAQQQQQQGAQKSGLDKYDSLI